MEELILTPRVVSVLVPHVHRFRTFEIHAVVPGTWMTLLPVITSPAPSLSHLQIFTTLPDDVAKLTFFGGMAPRLRSFQMTGAFPVAHISLLSNLTLLRLESVPLQYRPTTAQFATILRACPKLVSLSLLDAGPVADMTHYTAFPEERVSPAIQLHYLRALAFRDTDGSVQEGTGWFFNNVHIPNLLSLHIMQVPGRTIAKIIPPLLHLEELYLWAPHATCADIIALLWRLPVLKTLELPMVKSPIEVFTQLSVPQVIRQGDWGGRPRRAATTTYAEDSPRDDSYDDHSEARGMEDHAWLLPCLERIGTPFVPAEDGKALEDAFKRLFRGRAKGVERGTLAQALMCVMAPGGRPEYIGVDVWEWIGRRAMIRTLATGMDMLFDAIPLWTD